MRIPSALTKMYYTSIIILIYMYTFGADPPDKLTFDSQKIAKNFHFFSKKLPMAIFLKKKKIFGNFFGKNVKFLAIF